MVLQTTLVYIEKDEKYLMLHRIKKKNDVNEGKWIGVGGKFEAGEDAGQCMRREVWEETGLTVSSFRYCGVVRFISDRFEDEDMHLFTVDGFTGDLKECEEGELVWVDKTQLTELPHWDGDLLFLSMILNRQAPFFHMTLQYEGDRLVDARMSFPKEGDMTEAGHTAGSVPEDGIQTFSTGADLKEDVCFVTERLLLRPWTEADASDLYRYAQNPNVGPHAGWLPHQSEEESRKVIRELLSAPYHYAILRHDGTECIGSIALRLYQPGDHNYAPETGELGYWIGEEFWGRGYAAEAAQCLIRYAFDTLHLKKVWAGFYEGNTQSERVMHKCGMRYDHSLAQVPRNLLGDSADEHFLYVTPRMFIRKFPG